jgi:hypothetical protein
MIPLNTTEKIPYLKISDTLLYSANEQEMRGVWLNDYAFNSPETRTETIEKIEQCNLNTIFLIAPPIEDNNGWSEVEDFTSMLSLAKSKGLTIYVWMCNMYRIEGQLADFTNSSEREAQKDWALALLEEYNLLDGIHFDYIRYNMSSNAVVNQTKMNGILDTLVLTKNAINTQFPNKVFSTATFPLSGETRNPEDFIPSWYSDWFNDSNNNDVNRWNRSAYEYKGIPTPFRVQQDPKRWIVNNVINFTISMEYCYETSWWKGEVDIWNNWLYSNISKVYMGLGYYSKVWKDPDITPDLVAQEIVQKVHYGRGHNISGFSIFEFGEPGNDDYILIDALTKGADAPFKDQSVDILLLEYFRSSGESDSFNIFIMIFMILGISLIFISIMIGFYILKKRT